MMTALVKHKLPINFLIQHSDQFDLYLWDTVCKYQELNEEFIEMFEHEVSWQSISSHQNLSTKFIKKHFDKIDLARLGPHNKVTFSVIKKHLPRFSFNYLLTSRFWNDKKQIHHLVEFLYKQEFVVFNSDSGNKEWMLLRLDEMKNRGILVLNNGSQQDLPFNYPYYETDLKLRDLYQKRLVANINKIKQHIND